MIKILSTEQALNLRGKIPELAIQRSVQFQCEGYLAEDHGYIAVLENGDFLANIPGIGTEGLFDSDGFPIFEYVELLSEAGKEIYEVVIAVNTDFVIALIIPDEPWLDAQLRNDLRQATQGSTPAAL